MRSSTLTSFFLVFSLSAMAAAESDFLVYEARARLAEELKKAADDAPDGARVRVVGQKLVVYGSKAQRDAMLKLFQELDHKLRSFVVSVRAATEDSARRQAVGVSVSSGAVSLSAESASGDSLGHAGQRITITEGTPGRIYAGKGLFPSSVDVTVRPLGGVGARVEIRETQGSGSSAQRVWTEVNLPLGEWRTIGGTEGKDEGSSKAILATSRRGSSSRHEVQLRVDPVPR